MTLDNGLRAYCRVLHAPAAERPLAISAAAGGRLLAKPISQLMRQVTGFSAPSQNLPGLCQVVTIAQRLTDCRQPIQLLCMVAGGGRGICPCCGYLGQGGLRSPRLYWCVWTVLPQCSCRATHTSLESFLSIKVKWCSGRMTSLCPLPSPAGTATEAAWVDKYRPRTFLDLLSDEQVNRSVVRCDVSICQHAAVGRQGHLEAMRIMAGHHRAFVGHANDLCGIQLTCQM